MRAERRGYRDAVLTASHWIGRITNPVDSALAAAFAIAAGLETALVADSGVLRTVLGVLTVVPLAARRTAPAVSAALIGIGLATESFATESPDEAGVLLAVVVSAFSVTAFARRADALLGLSLLGMAVAASIAVDPSDDASNILPTLVLFIAIPAGIGLSFHRRGRDLAALAIRAEAAEREAEAAVEAERRRVARELHDMVSHAVTLIAVQAEAGQATLETDPSRARRSLEAIGRASRDAVDELHSLLAVLREPGGPTPAAGLADLPALVGGVRAAGLRVEVRHTGDGPDPGPEADHCAYRVIQEGLTNALRHSRSPRVTVSVTRAATELEVVVGSVGVGHQSSYGGSGSGLDGLRDRVGSVGGTLETSVVGDTFTLRARLPVGTP